MLTENPFALLAQSVPLSVIQGYVLLMAAAVVLGTLYDVYHKGSAVYFAERRERSKAAAQRQLSGAEVLSILLGVIAEAAVSGEFCKWPRRVSHLLMMYGFLFYVLTTIAMVFGYPEAGAAPPLLPALWTIGALMILAGGLWFFFFLRVDVAYDGASPFHLGRADLFVGSLIASAAGALVWHFAQTAYGHGTATWVLFALYVFFTTLLFVTVPWSKFAHMFFKPAVRFQRRIEEANGSSDLPAPARENFIVRS
jgi:hypothetical protein